MRKMRLQRHLYLQKMKMLQEFWKTGNTKAGNSESKGAEAEKQKDPDEELYWIQPYGEENQEPIVITVYKK